MICVDTYAHKRKTKVGLAQRNPTIVSKYRVTLLLCKCFCVALNRYCRHFDSSGYAVANPTYATALISHNATYATPPGREKVGAIVVAIAESNYPDAPLQPSLSRHKESGLIATVAGQ